MHTESANCNMQIVICKLQYANRNIQTAISKLQYTNFNLQTSISKLKPENSSLQYANCNKQRLQCANCNMQTVICKLYYTTEICVDIMNQVMFEALFCNAMGGGMGWGGIPSNICAQEKLNCLVVTVRFLTN